MPQYQDLHVFGGVAAREQRQPAEQPDHEQVERGGRARVPRVEAQVRCSARVLAPRRYKLTRIGVDLVTMAELMGHASLETTRLYTRPNAADMQRAVDLLTVDG